MKSAPSPDRQVAYIVAAMIGVTFGLLFLILLGRTYGVGAVIWVVATPAAGWVFWRARARVLRATAAWLRNSASQARSATSDQIATAAPHGSNISSQRPAEGTIAFHGIGSVLDVHDRTLASPMVYCWDGAKRTIDEPSLIETRLKVGPPGSVPDRNLPYWPSYRECSTVQRAQYLDWLNDGRRNPEIPIGYVFIYFYGLERRVLLDNADHGAVFEEVRRLQSIYCPASRADERNSFRNYSTSFLWFLAACKSDNVTPKQIRSLASLTSFWPEQKLASALAWFVERSLPMPYWMAYVVAEQSPHARRSVVVRRVEEQFRELFKKRYEDEHGNGIRLRCSKHPRNVEYCTASAVLGSASTTIANPLGIPSQFKSLANIWNSCIEDLRKLSSVARNLDGSSLNAAAWEALPPDIRASTDHPCNDAVCELFIKSSDDSGHVFARAGELAAVSEVPDSPRLTPKQARQLASTVEHVGFGIEPDARLTGKGYQRDDLLAVFPMAYEGEVDPTRYAGAACLLRIGLAVSEADGRIDDEELSKVTEHIEAAFDLNDHEQRRLEALRGVLLQTGSDLAGVGKRLRDALNRDQLAAIGRVLVAVAASDGVITASELKTLRRCYRAMELEPELLESTIAELAPEADESPVSVTPGHTRPQGERIPNREPSGSGVALDREKIARIMRETREVSVLLADAMGVDDIAPGILATAQPESSCTAEPASESSTSTPRTEDMTDNVPAPTNSPPPPRFASFLAELADKAQWSRAQAELLAAQHGHMLGAAVEAINEWAFDTFDEQLIFDDEAAIEIDLTLLETGN